MYIQTHFCPFIFFLIYRNKNGVTLFKKTKKQKLSPRKFSRQKKVEKKTGKKERKKKQP